jgi:hypothetical protein
MRLGLRNWALDDDDGNNVKIASPSASAAQASERDQTMTSSFSADV